MQNNNVFNECILMSFYKQNHRYFNGIKINLL